MEGWDATGKACMDWLLQRPEVDPERIALSGRSFGSFGATLCAAGEPRYRACAVSATCHEPGWHTIFEEASPTFKMRFMYMANYTDEAKFDEFRKSLTWEGRAEKIRMPYFCAAGEFDELSPLEQHRAPAQGGAGTEALRRLPGGAPRDRRRAVHQSRAVPAGAGGGLDRGTIPRRIDPSERWFVNSTGRIAKTALS